MTSCCCIPSDNTPETCKGDSVAAVPFDYRPSNPNADQNLIVAPV